MKILVSSKKALPLHSISRQGRSSAGLERFSHIEEVIGSSPIGPTEREVHRMWASLS